MNDLLKLQNGSDVRGVAAEGIEGEHVNLTADVANRISQAFAVWLAEKRQKAAGELRIGVGHDSRITADSLTGAALQGIMAKGAAAYDCGLVSTPSMFMTTIFEETLYDGAIMVTASHLPFNRNGLKFFDCDGGLESADIKAILTIAQGLEAKDGGRGEAPKADTLSLYTAHLRRKICRGVKGTDGGTPLKGLHIVVDAGNGAGGFFVSQVLEPLGADTAGSQFLEPDGMFPNHIPNPENKKAMDSIKEAVLSSKADLGIIFDTDVDRMSAVLANGTEVNRDAIIAMMAAILASDYPGGTIVTDSVTSDRLKRFLEDGLGMRQHRFKRGYKNVINESKRLNNEGTLSPLAIETSGHGALSENYFLDDGAYMAVKLLIALALAARDGKKLDAYIEKLEPEFEAKEYRLKIRTEAFKSYGTNVLEEFEKRAVQKGYRVEPNSYEGVRLTFDSSDKKGWALLRLSLHDPVMPLNIEGYRQDDCAGIAAAVKELLAGFDQLDFGGQF